MRRQAGQVRKWWLGAVPPSLRVKLAGICLMVAAMQVVATNDAFAKELSQYLPVLLVVFLRPAFQSVFLLTFLGASRQPLRFRIVLGKRHILRGFLWWLSTMLFFFAIRDNDIPEALALFFTGPLFMAVTAPLFLKERFEPRFVGAAAVGFAGALLILQPAGDVLDPVLLLSLLAGISYSGYFMATRHAAHDRRLSATEVALGGGLWASLFGLPFAVWQLGSFSLYLVVLAVAMGFMSALGHLLIAMACQRVEASNLAPYTYTEMVGAVVASFLLFGTLPAGGSWLGIVLIVSGGAWAALDTRHRRPEDLDQVV